MRVKLSVGFWTKEKFYRAGVHDNFPDNIRLPKGTVVLDKTVEPLVVADPEAKYDRSTVDIERAGADAQTAVLKKAEAFRLQLEADAKKGKK